MDKVISIKGVSPTVLAAVFKESAPFDVIEGELKNTLEKNAAFFRDAHSLVYVSGKEVNALQREKVVQIFAEYLPTIKVSFDGGEAEAKIRSERKALRRSEPPKSMVIESTLRSGQRIECEGDVIVLGDVNDGAEVVAGGNIVVMGTLRGLAHAGATGRDGAVVAANRLCPKQLRINAKIAVFPQDAECDVCQVAKIMDGSITISDITKSKGKVTK